MRKQTEFRLPTSRVGKTAEMARFAEEALKRGETVFVATKAHGLERVVSVDTGNVRIVDPQALAKQQQPKDEDVRQDD